MQTRRRITHKGADAEKTATAIMRHLPATMLKKPWSAVVVFKQRHRHPPLAFRALAVGLVLHFLLQLTP
jgi:hypothetical protein